MFRHIDRLFLMISMTASLLICVSGISSAEPKSAENNDEKGFVPLFNGKDLSNWEGNFDLWKVKDKMIVGDSPGIKQNEFLATKKSFGDFELRLEFRMKDGKGNSGVQFRSKRLPNSKAIEGYQADLGANFWGCLYDEHRRRKVLVRAPKKLDEVLKKGGWNSYVIRAQGDHIVQKINGLTTVDYREPDDKIARKGIIALQVHSGPKMKIEFRKIRIKVLK